jgi:hypothetical protein
MKRLLFLTGLAALFSTCTQMEENTPTPPEPFIAGGGGTYALLKTLRPGEKIVLSVPKEVLLRSESETCNCNAKVTSATPPWGGFYVWAVGVYHSLPFVNCNYSLGPAGILWSEGDAYDFTICESSSQIILEFAVSPPIHPAQWVPVSVTVRLSCAITSPDDIRYRTFTAEPGEEVVDERAFFNAPGCKVKPR